jgi:hypothetical protein
MPLPDVQLDRRFRGLVEEATRRSPAAPRWSGHRQEGPARPQAGERAPEARLVALQAYDGERYEPLTGANGGAGFRPLGAAPQAGAALYLGFDGAFGAGLHALDVRACPMELAVEEAAAARPPASPVRASWEYWAGAAGRWRRLTVVRDGTSGLVRSGTLAFEAPVGMRTTRVGLFGSGDEPALYWLRYRLEHVGAGCGPAPRLEEVRLSTACAVGDKRGRGRGDGPLVLVRRAGAVRAAELELLAMRAPGARVRRARALPVRHPDVGLARPEAAAIPLPGAVTVLVVPDLPGSTPLPDAGTLAAVADWLHGHRLLAAELYVAAPRYRSVEIEARVVADPRCPLEDLQESLTRRLLDYFHPLRGGAAAKGWRFGGAIHFSETYRQILNTPGVARVEPEGVTTCVDGKPVEHGADVTLAADELVYSVRHTVFVSYA